MCNIPIYFCNIRIKHLQYTSETYEILETDACNMQFKRKHLLAAWRMEARQHVEFAEDSDPAVLVSSGSAVAARQGREAAASRRAWQGQ
jgi:hypothetical protein